VVRLGGLLAFFGFGSVVLDSFGWQFRILTWAEPMQPWLGIVLGLAGVAVLAAKFLMNKDASPDGATAGEGFAPPPGGFAPPPNVQRGHNPSQHAFQPGQGVPPGAGEQTAPMGTRLGARQGARAGSSQGAEPVLGRPQFAPQVAAAPQGQQRQAPPAGLPQFPPRQQPPQDQQPFGKQG
jgi:hypothetical protein